MDIENKFSRIKHWFKNQWFATGYDVERLVNTNRNYLMALERNDEVIKAHDAEVGDLERTIDRLKVEHKKQIRELEQLVQGKNQQYTDKVNEIDKKYRNLIISLCDSYNIRSPFDAHPSFEPIVQKDFFQFSEMQQLLFLEKLKSIKIEPNDEQKMMLFSENPSTCVQAGAGSGKSTMLASRVAFLHLEKNIPLENITVTTFTRESRREFIEKLINNINLLSNGRRTIDYDIGKIVVRTFHSIAYKVHKICGDGRRIIFGDWTPLFEDNDGKEVDIENLSDLSVEERKKKYKRDRSIPAMSDVMIWVYKRTYTANLEFRVLIDELFNASIKQMSFNQKSPEKTILYKASHQVEKSLSDLLFSDWVAANKELYSTQLINFPPIDTYKVEDGNTTVELNYHVYLPKQNVRVFLSDLGRYYKEKAELPSFENSKYPLSSWVLWRKLFVHFKASNNYIWVDSYSALQKLLKREEEYDETIPPPLFSYACVGELVKSLGDRSFSPIYDQFHNLSEFIYSLGNSICDIDLHKNVRLFNGLPSSDYRFLKAAIIFSKALEAKLMEERLITFEQVFHEFKDEQHQGLNSCTANSLSWCEHLLIDEFQDVSRNIINFLNNIKRIYVKKTQSGSIMFVGDGNQSIYVWRGSSYLYIKFPDKYFPVPCKFSMLTLRSNYRSSEKVIKFAKLALDKIGTGGSLVAARVGNKTMESILLIKRPIEKMLDYDRLAEHLESEVNRIEADEKKPVYLIFRGHGLAKDTGYKKWDDIFHKLTNSGQVKDLTIHTSKGLEAKSVFILGDITPGTWNPLKEAIYSWCGVDITYEEAQQHEAYCLGYVAITRAENNVYWYLNDPKENGLASCYLAKWPAIVS